ncbi:MAG: ABC transporter permease subunit [Saprospiraceae bacterium]|nr:ABC transporter permease subunit [Saprospiraceae bacterium]
MKKAGDVDKNCNFPPLIYINMSLFTLRGKLDRSQSALLGTLGLLLFLSAWWGLAEVFSEQKPVIEGFEAYLPSSINEDGDVVQIDRDSLARADSLLFANATEFEKVYPVLPPPQRVFASYPTLLQEDELASNTWRSVWLNIQGYFWAVLIALPIGFFIGLFPLFRGLFSRQVDAMRYLPLTALTGLFIIWFGIDDQMKIAFLAFGIIVYLLPVVVQRIDEVQEVYLQTVFTLGATNWQTIKTVYFPAVMAKLMDDIRVLTAISWTYIIIAELINRRGGIGSLIYIKARQGQLEKVFAMLIVIILIGFLQDRIFAHFDKRLFPHKYLKTTREGLKETEYGILTVLGAVLLLILQGAFVPALGGVFSTLAPIAIVTGVLIMLYGEFKLIRTAAAN